MACSRGKANPNSHTKLMLFADSAGYCQNPDCNQNLFLSIGDKQIHIAEMAHIISAGDEGPRANKKVSKISKGDFSNLILLCPTCHTKIDKAETEFPENLILKWKKDHNLKIKELFEIRKFESRTEAKNAISSLLNENKFIFDKYGPETDERFNPESEMPKIWLLKIRQNILPNNRKILSFIETNKHLLNKNEELVKEAFKQHVYDLENKHINHENINASQFPIELNNIFN